MCPLSPRGHLAMCPHRPASLFILTSSRRFRPVAYGREARTSIASQASDLGSIPIVSHNLGAVIQHLRDAIRVAFGRPLFLGQVSGELRGVLEDEHKSYIVDVCEQLRDGWVTPSLAPW